MAKKVKKKTKKTAVKKAVKKKVVKKTVVKKAAKKKIAKKTAKKSTRKKVSRTRKSKLTAKELASFRELLVEKLKEIVGDVQHIESGALKTSRQDSAGDLSSMPIHMADIGSDNYEQEFSLGLMDSERKIVREIHEAIKRIQEGTYGICEGTGEPIPKMRLKGIPWTRYCVKFAELVEKGMAIEPDHAFMDESELGDDEEEDMDDEQEDSDDSRVFFYGYDDEDDDEDEEDGLHRIE
ncbi:MAG: TraR/DksA family transcriptional regulator [Planctomycetota bacterium]